MEWLPEAVARYAILGYPLVFLGVLLESAAIPVPGETVVLLAGFLASPAGGRQLDLDGVIIATVLAAILGDNLGYWFGHHFARPRLQAGGRFLILTPKSLQMAEDYFRRYGSWTICLGRFVAGLRIVGALAAGTAGMVWWRFFLANLAGAVAWAVTVSLLGYFFGHSLHLLHEILGRAGLVLGGLFVVVLGLPWLIRHVVWWFREWKAAK